MSEFVEAADADACEIRGCDRTPAVRLDVPWEDDLRDVCTAHARAWASKEGVVAMPVKDAGDWPDGSGA